MSNQFNIVFISDIELDTAEWVQFKGQLQRVGIQPSSSPVLCVIDQPLKRQFKDKHLDVFYQDKKHGIPIDALVEMQERLKEKLETFRPNVIVPLGNLAFQTVMGFRGIDKWRGSILESDSGMKVIPTLHPSHVMRAYGDRPIVLKDLQRIAAEAWTPVITLPKRNHIIMPDSAIIRRYILEAEKAGEVSVDIETQWGTRISCIGLSYDKGHSLTIPFVNNNGEWFSLEEKQLIHMLLNKHIFSNPKVKIVGQNFAYDWAWLAREGFDIKGFDFDSWVAYHVLYPEMSKSLSHIASIETREPYWKDEGKDHKQVKDWERYWKYNGKDAAVTKEICEKLRRDIKREGLQELMDFEMSLVPIFVKQTLRGIKFDTEKQKALKQDRKQQLELINVKVDEMLPEHWVCFKCAGVGTVGKKLPKKCPDCGGHVKHINLRSSAQVKKLIFEEMKLPKALKKTTGNVTTDEEALLRLQIKHPHPIFEQLLKCREVSKELDFLNTKVSSDGRIRTTFACSTETGRLSSNGSPFNDGTNIQNIKRSDELRSLFVPDAGKVFIAADYAKAEAMVVAFESGDPLYVDVFNRGLDIHTINAQAIFDKTEIAKKERQLGKRVCHGLNYGMGPVTMCDSIVHELGYEYAITVADAKRFSKLYFDKFKGIKRWHKKIEQQLVTQRMLVNSFGRRRTFYGRPTGETLRTAIAYLPQSTVADLTNRSVKRVSGIEGIEFLAQKHDEILVQCDMERKEEMMQKLAEAMTEEITAVGTGMKYVIPIDMKTGMNWGEME